MREEIILWILAAGILVLMVYIREILK